jgi:hypothetical protein
MKRTDQNDYVTKQDLKEAFREFAKTFRKELLQDLLPAIDTRIDIKLEAMERRIDDRARKYNSDILSRFDALITQLRNERTDQVINTDKINKHQVTLKDHESRIKKLERQKN